MSFSRFIYFSAAWGAVAAALAWVLGRASVAAFQSRETIAKFAGSRTGFEDVLGAGVKGLFLGAMLGLGLACVDALGDSGSPFHRIGRLVARAGTAIGVGATGGWVGGLFAQFLWGFFNRAMFFVIGWMFAGLLIGAAPASFDVIVAWLRGRDATGAWRKVRNGLLGGSAGGLLGGSVALVLLSLGPRLFPGKSSHELWTPSFAGFVALGACIGLAVGLAQVILREAWLRVEAGFRPGRELILSLPETTIGRAETSDIGLFGDPNVAATHARILRKDSGFVLIDGGSKSGTYVNNELITEPTTLNTGDQIRVGRSLLSFGERARRPVR
jgi:hypothetical protein